MPRSSEWIWGRRPVLEALSAGGVETVAIARGSKHSPIMIEILRLSKQSGAEVRELPREVIQELVSGANTQGVAARIGHKQQADLDDLLAAAVASSMPPLLLVLDQIQDPQNLGSILRTAEAAGVNGVVIPKRRSAHGTGSVAKASAGAINYVQIAEVPNLAAALGKMKEAGLWIVGLEGSAEGSIFTADLTVPLALVAGNEAQGLRRLTRERSDLLVHLPMLGKIQSLNAAVATGIALYEVLRQRTDSASDRRYPSKTSG